LSALELHNERELLLLVSKGDQKAFRQLFDHYWDHICSVAFTFTKSVVLSEEIAQDVFTRIWQKRDRLTSVEKFDAYLFTTAKNHIFNQFRKRSLEQSYIEHLEQYCIDYSALPEQKILVQETQKIIEKLVAELPEQQRTVYELNHNEGLDYSEIASRLGISRLTAKSHMVKALRTIRQSFRSYTGEVFCFFFIIILILF
jgi:RNA polymerase sigma-70 factor (ECF subfamily)